MPICTRKTLVFPQITNLTTYWKHVITLTTAELAAGRHNNKELKIMKQKRIFLPTIEDAKKFVEAASKCDFEIDIFYNRIIIDAKSILGVLSLDLTRVLTVCMDGEDAEFAAYLEELATKAATAA